MPSHPQSPPKSGEHVPPPIRVLVVESQNLIRRGLRDLFASDERMEVVALAATAREALLRTKQHADVAVIGVRLEDGDGVDLAARMTAMRPQIRILLLAPPGDRSAILRAVSGGAHGFLQIDADEAELLSGVREIAGGRTTFDPQIAAALMRERLDRIRFLTSQERLVLELLAEGLPNRDIAERAHLAEKTVRNYVSRVLLKLGVRNRTEAALYATHHAVAGA